MERNLDRRVEVLCPILDPAIRDYVRHVLLGTYLRDDSQATVLHANGQYEPVRDAPGSIDAQNILMAARRPDA